MRRRRSPTAAGAVRKSARTLPPSIADSLPAALETVRRSSCHSACVTRASGGGAAHCRNCVARREPWKLPTAPSSSRVSNRSQTSIGLSQRSLVKRATRTSGSAWRCRRGRQSLSLCRPAWSRRQVARGPAQRSRRSAARSLAPQRNASASTVFEHARRTIGSTSLFSNTHWH
jgi:hypothetical protein